MRLEDLEPEPVQISNKYQQLLKDIYSSFDIIAKRTFSIRIAPKNMMTIDEIRNREKFKKDGFVNDEEFFNTPRLKSTTVQGLIDIIRKGNVTSAAEIGIENANRDVPVMYEAIDLYIRSWIEMYNTQGTYAAIPMDELRALESVNRLFFNRYKEIKLYLRAKEFNKAQQSIQSDPTRDGLLGLAGIFAMGNKQLGDGSDINFISHIDNYMSNGTVPSQTAKEQNKHNYTTPSLAISNDSLFSGQSKSDTPLADWAYKV